MGFHFSLTIIATTHQYLNSTLLYPVSLLSGGETPQKSKLKHKDPPVLTIFMKILTSCMKCLTDHDCDGRKPCSSSLLRNLSTPLLPITQPKDTKTLSPHSLNSQLIRNRCLCHGQEGSSTEAAGAAGGTGDAGAAAAASLDLLLLLLLLCSLTAAAACSSLGRLPAGPTARAGSSSSVHSCTPIHHCHHHNPPQQHRQRRSHRHFRVWNNKHSC